MTKRRGDGGSQGHKTGVFQPRVLFFLLDKELHRAHQAPVRLVSIADTNKHVSYQTKMCRQRQASMHLVFLA